MNDDIENAPIKPMTENFVKSLPNARLRSDWRSMSLWVEYLVINIEITTATTAKGMKMQIYGLLLTSLK